MNMTFEEFVRYSIDKDKCMVEKNIHARTTENMLKYIASQCDRTFIYNYDRK